MFPKPIGVGRFRVGSISGTVSEIQENSSGKIYYTTSLTGALIDPDDVIQSEYWNGSSWVEIADAAISTLDYVVGLNLRVHVKNSFFNYSGPYITGTAGTVPDTGGYITYSTTLQGLGSITINNLNVIQTNVGVTADVIIPAGMVGYKIRARFYGSVITRNGSVYGASFDSYQDVTSINTTPSFSFNCFGDGASYAGSGTLEVFAVYTYPDSITNIAQGQVATDTFGF